MSESTPKIIVLASLFPNVKQPGAGLFIRERMFRVASTYDVAVVSPKAWFPGQGIVRLFYPNYRPLPNKVEKQQGIDVYFPRFFSLPFFFRSFDGLFMALACFRLFRKLKRDGFNIVDAHFAYPDGYAATLLSKWVALPVTVTLRGTEVPQSKNAKTRIKLSKVFKNASAVIGVADSLRNLALSLGLEREKSGVIGNGVDIRRFHPIAIQEARQKLGISLDAKVMITVGGLVERKGFHRVIECMPQLLEHIPNLVYLIVGGGSPEGNMQEDLEKLVKELQLTNHVRFLGAIKPDDLKWPLSASDLFVLSTRNEGWANVFLEAMACGLPVVATDVGGNREVVNSASLGMIVPFGDKEALSAALVSSLTKSWDQTEIVRYAQQNSWDSRMPILLALLNNVVNQREPWSSKEES